MKKGLFILPLFCLVYSLVWAQSQAKIQYVDHFDNSHHPQIAYWFLTPAILENGQYLKDLDSMISKSPFDFIFLDAREGCSLEDQEKMLPIVGNIVKAAHLRNVKVGYRARLSKSKQIPESSMERFIAEGETKLDGSGKGSCSMDSKYVRSRKSFKQQVYKVFLFKKTKEGGYHVASLLETKDFQMEVEGETIKVKVDAGAKYKGYTAYVMAEFIYNILSNHSKEAPEQLKQFLDGYAGIPFDGVMLDEYSNFRLMPPWLLHFKLKGLRLRSFSIPFGAKLKNRTGQDPALTFLQMRYAPDDQEGQRIKSINTYMDLMREGAMQVENVLYAHGKKIYGSNCFIAAHNTFHNSLIHDDIWATGIKWWSIPRDNGFSDEKSPIPTRMGIALAYPSNIMYNMYYDYKIKRFANKTLTELQYGVRTFYHAFNDTNWGIGLEQPSAVAEIKQVERCARLLNRFNPSLPEMKLLIIFGNEALQNWYPNQSTRGKYDINSHLKIEEKAVQIWKAGYRNALVPSDLISEGKLRINSQHQAELNGHVFDAIVYLYPQFAKSSTISFLEDFASHGGKLMLVGSATHDFDGNFITEKMDKLKTLSTVNDFDIASLPLLGLSKNAIDGGTKNEDGSYVFTDTVGFRKNKSANFSFELNGNVYSGKFKGLAAIKIAADGSLDKLAAAGFQTLFKNGLPLFSLSKESDVYLKTKEGLKEIVIVDPSKQVQIVQSESDQN
ncbi:MAG: hypothetical protein B7Y15_01745 [Bacteroidetes bacterium 24-39-8]|nr:MAG: hypothetical protein B7Y15_01745 [Bacteroidetes bacterium 24-39-8]HQS54377.1 hypothetical protein [Sediminibacterium sp.]